MRRLVAGIFLLTIFAAPSGAQDKRPEDVMIGQLVPTFAWPSMDDSLQVISPLSLQGRFVLIDLWGTWCAPCRKEMPFLHAAYERFHSRGFDIVSVAFDRSPGLVAAFRREQFAMPWQHVYATYAIEAEATRLFHAESFPRAILLDSEGVVRRVDVGLRGPALAATLDSLLPPKPERPR